MSSLETKQSSPVAVTRDPKPIVTVVGTEEPLTDTIKPALQSSSHNHLYSYVSHLVEPLASSLAGFIPHFFTGHDDQTNESASERANDDIAPKETIKTAGEFSFYAKGINGPLTAGASDPKGKPGTVKVGGNPSSSGKPKPILR